MKAYVDKGICIGCGICPSVCSDIYEMEDDGKAVAKNMDIPDSLMDDAKDAEAQCPVNAISLE